MDILDLLMKQRDSLIKELGVYTEMCSKLAFDNLAPINKRIKKLSTHSLHISSHLDDLFAR